MVETQADVKVVWHGHASVDVRIGDARFITDPVLRARLAHLRRYAPAAPLEPGPIDAVLLSHLHHDHLDLPTIRRLPKATPLVVPRGSGIGVARTWTIVVQSVNGIRAILTGAIGADNLQGPLGIAQASGATASQGLSTFMTWIAIISTAIGFLNLFPIPVLDGGHFVAFLIEAVRGRPPSPAAMQVAMSIGLGLILLLMVFATYNDIMRMVS